MSFTLHNSSFDSNLVLDPGVMAITLTDDETMPTVSWSAALQSVADPPGFSTL